MFEVGDIVRCIRGHRGFYSYKGIDQSCSVPMEVVVVVREGEDLYGSIKTPGVIVRELGDYKYRAQYPYVSDMNRFELIERREKK